MDDKRIFSEQEAADLIVQAAKLQESDGDGATYSAGVSWAELQRMAGDVGVDPEYLRRALAGGKPGSSNVAKKPRQFLGMPLSEEFERVVDAEIAPENFDVIAGEFYNPGYGGGTAGSGGYMGPSIIGRMIKGQFYEGLLYGTMEVSSRHGRTRIKAKTSNAVGTWAIMGPIMFVWLLIVLGISSKSAGALFLPNIAAWGIGLSALWAIIGAALRSARSKVPDRIERIAIAILDEAEVGRSKLEKSSAGHVNDEEPLRQNLSQD